MNYLNSLYQQVLLSISIVLPDCEKQVKVRKTTKSFRLTNSLPVRYVLEDVNFLGS